MPAAFGSRRYAPVMTSTVTTTITTVASSSIPIPASQCHKSRRRLYSAAGKKLDEHGPQQHGQFRIQKVSRAHLLKTPTFGVPNHWTRYFDMLLWSCRGNVDGVHAQIQDYCGFRPPLSVAWVRLRLQETASEQLDFLRRSLPGEIGTIQRVKIREAVLNAGRDFFYQGPEYDHNPDPISSDYGDSPPLPPGAPDGWVKSCDALVHRAVRRGASPPEVLKILRIVAPGNLKGLSRGWLEIRMAQSGYFGLDC